MALKIFNANSNEIVKSNGNRVNKIIKNFFKFKNLKNNKFKNLIYISNIRAIKKYIILISNIKDAFKFL